MEEMEQQCGERSALVQWAVVLQMPLACELLGLHIELAKVPNHVPETEGCVN